VIRALVFLSIAAGVGCASERGDAPDSQAVSAAGRSSTVAQLATSQRTATIGVAVKTVSGNAFVDSIGLNTHFNYAGTAYVDSEPAVVAAIIGLHVKHLREGMLYPFATQFLTYRDAVSKLSAAGVRDIGGVQASDLKVADFKLRWATWFDSVGGLNWVEAAEPPNECDLNGCLANSPAYQKTLYDTIKGYAPSASVDVFGPSFANSSSYARTGDLSRILDDGNAHLYLLSQPPETTGVCRASDACTNGASLGSTIGNTFSLEGQLATARAVSASKAIVNTEAGYCTTVAANGNTQYNDMPRSVQATYWPRYLLHAFADVGIRRSYVYDIADDGLSPPTFDQCGLIDAHAKPKPSYRILKTLLDTVDDPGASYSPVPLAFTVAANVNVDGNPVEAIALGSRGGNYTLALWNPVSVWYQQSGNGGAVSHPLAVAPIAASVSLGTSFASATMTTFDPATGDATTTPIDPKMRIAVSVKPTITLVTLRK
jgi:hypothetical protein